MPLNRPFIDSAGLRGRPRLSTSRKVNQARKPENIIKFELYSKTHLRLTLPGRKPIMITQRNAVSLAHWLLDVTSRS